MLRAVIGERRTHRRYDVWFPVQVDAGQLGNAVGISKDASATGLRLDVNAELVIGAPVRVRFRVSAHESAQDVDGTIVRAQRNGPEEDSDWPYQLAVEFDDPQPSLDQRLHSELLHQRPGARA